MKSFHAFFVILIAVLFIAPSTWAVRVSSIYQASVLVPSQSDQDKNRILPQALQQVLVKVSGNAQVLNNPKITARLNEADTLVQTFGYSPSNDAARPYYAEVQFDPEGVNKILRDAAIPIWGINRPLVVSWVEYEAPGRPAELIDGNTGSELQLLLTQQAKQRGLPISLPVMDVTDLSQVSVNDIVTMNMPVLMQAAKRYNGDIILVARFMQQTDGITAQVKLIQGEMQWGWNISGKQLSAVTHTMIDHVADALASRYSNVVTNTVREKMTLTISGVAQQIDFTQMMQYLQHLEPVAAIQVKKISGNSVTLTINLRSDPHAFTQLLLLGKKLTPVTNDATNLAYQWNP